MNFEEAIEFFKGEELVEDITVLFSKDQAAYAESLRKIVSAWPKIKLERTPAKKPCPDDEYGRWIWLWDQVSYDLEEIKKITGVRMAVEALTKILIGNRIIYPDGTISGWAGKALKQFLKSQLGI